MKNNFQNLLLTLGVLCLCIVINPNSNNHKEAIKYEIIQAARHEFRKDMKEEDEKAKNLGDFFITFIVTGILNTYSDAMKYNNYYIFSTISGKENKTLSIGFLGKVYCLFDENDIRKELNKKDKK